MDRSIAVALVRTATPMVVVIDGGDTTVTDGNSEPVAQPTAHGSDERTSDSRFYHGYSYTRLWYKSRVYLLQYLSKLLVSCHRLDSH